MRKVLLEVSIGGSGIMKPEQLRELVKEVSKVLPPEIYGDSVVIVSGRLPVWAFATITHQLHPFRAVATFEPRLGKGVVVATHDPEIRLGELVDVGDAEKKTITIGEEEAQITKVKVT